MLQNLLSKLFDIDPLTPHILLLRHAEREAITPGEDGVTVDITQNGVKSAFEFGKQLTKRLK